MAVDTSYQRGEKFLHVINVMDILQRARHGRTSQEVADELGLNIRTAQRYLKQLRDAGVGVELDDENRWRFDENLKLPPMQFTKPEAVAVLIALRLLQQMRTTRDDALVGAVARLAKALQIQTVTSYLGTMLDAAEAMPQGGAREHMGGIIVQSFVDRIPCEVEYENFKGEVTKRVIRTYFLEPRPESRTIYAYALDDHTSSFRWFRLDRIRAARQVPIAGPYTVPDDFDISDVVKSSWGIWQAGDTLQEVVLRFAPECAARVREVVWYPDAQLTELPDGRTEWHIQVASEVEMRPWVLGWGAQVEVIAPPSLRKHVADTMRAAARMYDRQLSPP
jgi:predicted DNA-binding transcriptional regulator YafY